jgi:SAM-dependent methyltransferase
VTGACRSCGEDGLITFLALGETPLANSLRTEAELGAPEERFPLDVAFCEGCSLVQILETVPPERMFSEYLYFSSNSTTMVEHVGKLANRLTDERKLGAGSLVVEVASNDGYLLQWYQRRGVPVLGVEPARNIAEVALARGIDTRCAFFGRETAATLVAEGKRADVIHANNVLAHVPDLNGFVAGLASLVKPGGLVVIEAPYVRDLIDHLEFDTVYHEHLCYFSLTALDALFRRHGLPIIDVEHLRIHGGSLRIHAAQGGVRSDAVVRLLVEESQLGMLSADHYLGFSDRVRALGDSLTNMLRAFKADGRRIAAYGASAKGSTLLNTFGIGRDLLDFVVDRSPHKQGRYMPGVNLPIYSPSRLVEAQPDYTLLLTWNFADEILAQQAAYRERGGKFIVPIPSPRLM